MKTKLFEGFKKFTAWVVISQLLFAFIPTTTTYAKVDKPDPTPPTVEDKVMICHAKGNGEYNSQDVSVNSADPTGGHGGHEDDIIPAFYYNGIQYNGVNWPELSYIWLDNCNNDAQATFSVIYDGNGNTSGTEPFDGVLYNSGATVTVIGNTGNLEKTGADFTGWNTMANGSGTHYDPGDTFTITSNTILYAEWTTETFLVNFITDGGSPTPSDQTVSYGGHVVEPSDPDKTGYTFAGWYSDEGLTDLWGFATDTVTEDMTLYAKWNINHYGIYFDSDGGSSVDPIVLDYGSVVTPPSPPIKTGYTFAGWNGLIPSTMPAFDTYLTAEWEINIYNVEVSANGLGDVYGGGSYPYGSTVDLLAIPQIGWHFAGWSGDCGGSLDTYEITNLDQDYSCTANFEINTYDVFFDSNDGTPEPLSQTVSYGGTVTDPGAPYLPGHTFDAWCDITLTDPWSFATDTVSEDMTLYARYITNEYTVDFDSMGGTTVPSVQVLYEEEVPEPSDPAKVGNAFEGWYVDPDCITSWEFDSDVVMGDMTLYACWSVNEYTIYFNSTGGTPVDPITEHYGDVVTPPADPTKTGYTFAGWNPEVPSTMPAHDSYLSADWDINSYTIYFDSVGGTEVGPITQNFGTSVVAPSDPTKTGYTFAGWTPVVPLTMPAHDSYLVANWQVNQYTITFDSNGGSSVDPITQNFGTAVTAPDDPYWVGHTFLGWLPTVPATMPAHDQTVVAQWKLNTYTVSFDANGGNPTPLDQDVNYGGHATRPTDPALEGYSFVCWRPVELQVNNSESKTALINCWDFDEYAIYGDLDLQAVWQINQYTITFDSNGGSTVAPITQDYNTIVTAPDNPTRPGYTFAGWSAVVPATMPAYDQTLVASWVVNPVVIPTPTILTPIIPVVPLPVPVAAAAPAVAAAVDEPAQTQDVAAAQDEPVLGSSDKTCPWWWIIGLILLATLAFIGGVVRAEKDDSKIRKYYYVWPPLFSAIAFVAHHYLHEGFKATWFCDNYWLLMIVVAIVGELAYRALRKKKDQR